MLFDLKLNYFSTGIPFLIFCSFLVSTIHYNIARNTEKYSLNQDAIGSLFGVIGTIFSVMIGLVIFDVTSKYSEAHEGIVMESKYIIETNLYLKQFKTGGVGNEISGILLEYLDEVVASDWEHMATDTNNAKGRAIVNKLYSKIESIIPKTKNEEIYLPILVQSATSMGEARMIRFDVTTHSIPSYEWMLLLTSALLTILASFFYASEAPFLSLLCPSFYLSPFLCRFTLF